MAFLCRLVDGTAHIDLFYSVDAGWAMLEKGLEPNDPERRELWGGYLEDQLVRQEDGKRVIPLKLQGKWTTPDLLIDAVNALEEMLRHAARYRKDGWGSEVFLEFQLHNATYAVRYPVCSGSIDKNDLMNACGSMMESGHRVTKALVEVGITLVCENYWESTATYTLENYINNPGFWRGAVPGDSWTEVDVGGVLTLSWETTIWEVMGRSLKWVIAADAINSPGIDGGNITVLASTDYYFECRGYHTAGCDRITAYVYDVTHAAPLAPTVLYFNNGDNAWEKLGVTFTTPVGCVSVRITMNRNNADSTAGVKTFYCDAFYLGPGTTAPVGWSSGRNLVNHLDADPDNLNVLCVTEIPGEVEAEARFDVTMGATNGEIRIAKRTRDNPYNFIWELQAADAYATVDAHFGLTDATCIDSLKEDDATAPGGHRITVTFAGDQTMKLRCYWNITTNLASYYGKYAVAFLLRASAATDVIKVQMYANLNGLSSWLQSGDVSGTATTAPANEWELMDGWSVISWPIGTHLDDLWAAGNAWRIELHASITGTAAWDNLYVAGAYLIPLDEAYEIAGNSAGGAFQANMIAYLCDLDGDRGAYTYSAATTRYYSNVGMVGGHPGLTPEIDNWLYFILDNVGGLPDVDITDTITVSTTYRPRGIFLRGSNP